MGTCVVRHGTFIYICTRQRKKLNAACFVVDTALVMCPFIIDVVTLIRSVNEQTWEHVRYKLGSMLVDTFLCDNRWVRGFTPGFGAHKEFTGLFDSRLSGRICTKVSSAWGFLYNGLSLGSRASETAFFSVKEGIALPVFKLLPTFAGLVVSFQFIAGVAETLCMVRVVFQSTALFAIQAFSFSTWVRH